jgi:hypothetical protein
MRRVALLVSALAVLVVAAPAADAGCGAVSTARSAKNHVKGPEPFVVGDSVMLSAVKSLGRAGFNVNAQGCRWWKHGHAILRRKKRQGTLPWLVVIALGANWVLTREEIGRTRKLLGKKPVLALVTPRESGGRAGPDAARVRAAARAHRNVRLLDWVRYSRGHGGWFGGDGLHLTRTGVRSYVRCIRHALPFASGPRAAASARRHPCASRT